ncbi:uncharacterized protein LOC121426503 isoform X2 [Lytechinus variegatus]|uniref:uncharacterized protein LOC121426503 isoform X2 n=1 Tax=Lytechinus variegatus TaxID=7654 RepID=UPI001BB29579|nr:uncharacterized protein LOC121426503 isoform X2 [Lytechinus variegatus]
MNIMMNTSSSGDDRGSGGHHDQGQSPENHTHKVKRVEYETSPPTLLAMSIGCVAVLVATVLGCVYMCADCDPCVTCLDGEEPRLNDEQMASLKRHDALIHRFTQYPELLQREENQKYIVQLTKKQLEDIHTRYCFYFVNIPSDRRRRIDIFQIKDGNSHQTLQRRTLSEGTVRHHDNTVHRSTPKPLPTSGQTEMSTTNHLTRATTEDVNENLQVERLTRLKLMLIQRGNSTAQSSTQPKPGQVIEPRDYPLAEQSSTKQMEGTGTPAKFTSSGLRNEEAIADSSTVGTLLESSNVKRYQDGTNAKETASDEEYKGRKRRDEYEDEPDGELDNDEAGQVDLREDDSWSSSGEDVAICSARKVAYPVVLYINAAGNLVQIIQSESYDQSLANERCTQEYHTATNGNLTRTCLTTYTLKQAYALNLATLQFGREIIKMTQCTPVTLF